MVRRLLSKVRTMNKKEYIKPSIEVIELESDVIMTGGSNGVVGVFPGGNAGSEDQLSNDRRGSWGDLWN